MSKKHKMHDDDKDDTLSNKKLKHDKDEKEDVHNEDDGDDVYEESSDDDEESDNEDEEDDEKDAEENDKYQFKFLKPNNVNLSEQLMYFIHGFGELITNEIEDYPEMFRFTEDCESITEYLNVLLHMMKNKSDQILVEGLTAFEYFLKTCLNTPYYRYFNEYGHEINEVIQVFKNNNFSIRKDLVVDMFMPTEEALFQEIKEKDNDDTKLDENKVYTDDFRYEDWPFVYKSFTEEHLKKYLLLVDLIGEAELFDWHYLHQQFDWSILPDSVLDFYQNWDATNELARSSSDLFAILFESHYFFTHHIQFEIKSKVLRSQVGAFFKSHHLLPYDIYNHVLLSFVSSDEV